MRLIRFAFIAISMVLFSVQSYAQFTYQKRTDLIDGTVYLSKIEYYDGTTVYGVLSEEDNAQMVCQSILPGYEMIDYWNTTSHVRFSVDMDHNGAMTQVVMMPQSIIYSVHCKETEAIEYIPVETEESYEFEIN